MTSSVISRFKLIRYTIAPDISIQHNTEAWKVFLPSKSKTLSVSPKIAKLVVLLMSEHRLIEMAKCIKAETGFDVAKSCSLLRTLWKHSVIEKQSEATRRISREQSRWAKNGWRAAYTFFSYTRGFPFEDYASSGATADRNRMKQYRGTGTEPARSKKLSGSIQEFFAPTCEEACASLSQRPMSAVDQKPAVLSSKNLLSISAATFGVRRTRRVKGDPNVEPLLRKTSPSGGSLHPTEGYLFLRTSLDEMPSGVYHFSTATNSLDRFNEIRTDKELKWIFDGNYRGSFEPMGIWVLTSVFARNRFRYREPRTFRSIFLDVGHVLETLMLVSEAHGLEVYPHHGFDVRAVEKELCVLGCDEAAVMACSFGSSKHSENN